MNFFTLSIAILLILSPVFSAADSASVDFFAPEGTVKGVRQVTARFSEAMVAFGDPRLENPFDVNCPEAGSGRWADHRNWVYDFERDLPAGVRCTFRLKEGLAALSGKAVTGRRSFSFSTGGPAILQSLPHEGSHQLDEEQVFILGLDAPASEASILEHAYCTAGGIQERIAVRLLKGDERRLILDQRKDFIERYFRVLFKRRTGQPIGAATLRERGTRQEQLIKARDGVDSPIVVLQCRQSFPGEAEVKLVWGRGIESLGGVLTEADQKLAFKTRPEFRARFTCSRVNKDADCIPLLPMSLDFTAPVSQAMAAQIRLIDFTGKEYRPDLAPVPEGRESFVEGVMFKGPFPELSRFRLELPVNLKDDAGRTLTNARSFPLKVFTDEDPPLAKFASRFGIIELKAGALLPVTLRNLEAGLQGTQFKLSEGETIPGKTFRVNAAMASQVVDWLRRLQRAEGVEWDGHKVKRRNAEHSIFQADDGPLQAIEVPRVLSGREFEVVGIPLNRPGFYVVELSSLRLGKALLGENRPYYVSTGALVTNLAVHFKLGRESSLVWVTGLDDGRPVAGAEVVIADCRGKTYWQGRTDAQGLAPVRQALPATRTLPGCLNCCDGQYVVTASSGDDRAFAFSGWQEGISTWRFNLPRGGYTGPYVATTVFDRTLLRAGETVNMKHLIREHTGQGFRFVTPERLQGKIVLRHEGSNDRFEIPVTWDSRGVAESKWEIPKEAKQGTYRVYFVDRLEPHDPSSRQEQGNQAFGFLHKIARDRERPAGEFRVEAFRVPLMKATLLPPKEPLVNATEMAIGVQVNYLSGGGASYAPVKVRGLLQPRAPIFPDYGEFVLANGNVKEGIVQDGHEPRRIQEYTVEEEDEEPRPRGRGGDNRARPLGTQSLTLDLAGAGRAEIRRLPKVERPHEVIAEMEYNDPNGEILTASTRVPLWPARILLGVKPDGWALSKDHFRYQVVALDLAGKPVPGVEIKTDILQRVTYSHRKRLIGGFYAYESTTEVKRVADGCSGKTDVRGLLFCDQKSPASGELLIRAGAKDESGNSAFAHQSAWVAGSEDWWFEMKDGDRMDVLPERKRYEPGEHARLQVRMPFRKATALITLEREGVLESRVVELSGEAPVVEIPVKGHHAPNIFVSVLAVRGRVAGVPPTALIDLGKPAFRLGFTELKVGWRAHELKVEVRPEKSVYQVRDKAKVQVTVRLADGGVPPKGTEVALAAVDEGLLELRPNDSWNLLEAMMRRRGIEVETATAQTQVVGKRHFGRKAVVQGGGGGKQGARELFETLLLWKGRLKLDGQGRAAAEIALNDSLTAFRIVAVAEGATGRFGTGQATIRAAQDFMILSGLPPLVREQDRFQAIFTVRNTTEAPAEVRLAARVKQSQEKYLTPAPATRSLRLAAGEAKEAGWEIKVPVNAENLGWEVTLSTGEGAVRDRLNAVQKVVPAVPVRTFQATLAQLDKPLALVAERPSDAVPGRGGIRVHLRHRLADELAGVKEYMSFYPYICLEQLVSQAVALRDEGRWHRVMASLPGYLDRDGLAKYFPILYQGSDVLTSYLLAIAGEAGWTIPEDSLGRMVKGLLGFVQGKVVRQSELPTADVAIRKVAALDALARAGAEVNGQMLASIAIEPDLWPTSAVLDWMSLLSRNAHLPDRENRLAQAEQIIRSRLNFQGTVMGFSTERTDALWWLMISSDVNANRVILNLLDHEKWKEDLPRLVRGAVARQQKGRWNTTVANAWGVLAMEKFSERYEKDPVAGDTVLGLGKHMQEHRWAEKEKGGSYSFSWPEGGGTVAVDHRGRGKPWATIQSLAAIPLQQPFSSGYRIARTMTPVEQKSKGTWSRGDVYRVRLEIDAQSDMTWVVVNDPIPAGAAILGTGLGRDSRIFTQAEKKKGWVWPAFEERRFDSFRAYYRLVPKGRFTVEYTVRLNNPGRFAMPETRVEALYSPEMFGELPNKPLEVTP